MYLYYWPCKDTDLCLVVQTLWAKGNGTVYTQCWIFYPGCSPLIGENHYLNESSQANSLLIAKVPWRQFHQMKRPSETFMILLELAPGANWPRSEQAWTPGVFSSCVLTRLGKGPAEMLSKSILQLS